MSEDLVTTNDVSDINVGHITKTTIFLCALLLLSACDKPLSNEDIIKEAKVCREAGLRASAWHENFFKENSITRIECQPQ